ncbi:MAG: diguanylate cyclase [Chroococcales cyanobacterium]
MIIGSEPLTDNLQQELEKLRQEVEQLKRDKADLEILLDTTLDHADTIETELHLSNQKLQAEIVERQRVQAALEKSQAELQRLVEILNRDYSDLKIILETTTEHGDVMAAWLHSQSICDGLTGLFNRRYLEQSLIREIQKAKKNKQSLGIIMLDVDHFKRFNDTFGHEAGDKVLRELSRLIQLNIRASDIACRYGGEELTVILPNTSLEHTTAQAELLRQKVKQLKVQHQDDYLDTITVSVGVAAFPEHGTHWEGLLQIADGALYLAKAQGRDRVIRALSDNVSPSQQFLDILDKSRRVTPSTTPPALKSDRSILFADIRDFTKLYSRMSPQDHRKFIQGFLSRMEPAVTNHQGLMDHYIGDVIMALFSDRADNAVQAGISMLQQVSEYNLTRQRPERPPINIGIGVNTSSLLLESAGGYRQTDETIFSDAINLAARIQRLTRYYRIDLSISQHTFNRLEDPTQYAIRVIDQIKIRGKTTAVKVYEVFDADSDFLRQGKLSTKSQFEHALMLYHQNHFREAAQLFTECLESNSADQVAQIYQSRCYQQI